MKQTELRPTVRDLLPGYTDDEVKVCFAMGANDSNYGYIRRFMGDEI